jgi:2-keto-4-pentenoate hydratase/2-oxohepta-3-ene-1,7-dioic acid hydratase in catechol pathway
MKLGQFTSDETDEAWTGVVRDETVVHLNEAGDSAGIELPHTTRALLDQWNWEEKAELVVSYAEETGTGVYDRSEVVQTAPITNPEKVIAVGLNYSEHADEGDHDVPDEPVLFAKFPQCLVGPDDPIEWDPELTGAVDYEAELAVVIGERARNVSREDAFDYVAGYTVGNDVSARDLQNTDEQWVRGKSLDTFGPLGPDLLTPDELDDPHNLDIWTEVNGERLQDSNTQHLIFGIDEIIAFCSRSFTLTPGDVIYTGTPDGVGFFRDPQVLLEDGDTVTVGVDDVGELTNHCIER